MYFGEQFIMHRKANNAFERFLRKRLITLLKSPEGKRRVNELKRFYYKKPKDKYIFVRHDILHNWIEDGLKKEPFYEPPQPGSYFDLDGVIFTDPERVRMVYEVGEGLRRKTVQNLSVRVRNIDNGSEFFALEDCTKLLIVLGEVERYCYGYTPDDAGEELIFHGILQVEVDCDACEKT